MATRVTPEELIRMHQLYNKYHSYARVAREIGRSAARFYGWTVIECVRDGQMRSIEDIHEEIYRYVRQCLEG